MVQDFGSWALCEIAQGADRDPQALLAGYVAFVADVADREVRLRALKHQRLALSEEIDNLEAAQRVDGVRATSLH